MMKAVCFDMFCTLADPGRYPSDGECAILGVTPQIWGAAMWEESFCRDRGLGLIGTVREMIDRACDALPVPVTQAQRRAVCEAREERFRRMITDIDPGIVSTVGRLKQKGLRIGLISNADVCDRLHWADSPLYPYFDDTIFSCDVGLLKPDPAIYRLSLSRLGAAPGEALFVGDGGSDELSGARAVGMRTVCTEFLVRYPDREREKIVASADHVIRRFEDLLEIV